jgi:hypothetical protein
MIDVFMCFAIMDGLMMFIATTLPKVFEGIITTLCIQILMLLVAGYFRLGDELPKPVWTYPVSYLSFYTYAIQVFLELILVCVFHQIIKWILFVLDFAN